MTGVLVLRGLPSFRQYTLPNVFQSTSFLWRLAHLPLVDMRYPETEDRPSFSPHLFHLGNDTTPILDSPCNRSFNFVRLNGTVAWPADLETQRFFIVAQDFCGDQVAIFSLSHPVGLLSSASTETWCADFACRHLGLTRSDVSFIYKQSLANG